MSNQNKPNMNMFNQNSEIDQLEMLKQFRTKPLIKHIVAFLTGFLPMLTAILLVSCSDEGIEFGLWKNPDKLLQCPYGVMWAIAFSVLAFSIIISSLLVKFNKDVKEDVIPMVVMWSVVLFSLFIIPMPSKLWWLEIILLPIFAIIGFVSGMIGVMFYSVIKFTKELKKVQEENGGENPFGFNPENMNANPFVQKKPTINNKKSDDNLNKDKENKSDSIFENKDNPFVDIEEDDED